MALIWTKFTLAELYLLNERKKNAVFTLFKKEINVKQLYNTVTVNYYITDPYPLFTGSHYLAANSCHSLTKCKMTIQYPSLGG